MQGLLVGFGLGCLLGLFRCEEGIIVLLGLVLSGVQHVECALVDFDI